MTENIHDSDDELAENGATVDIEKEVYLASNKLRGLGELFCMARSEPPMSDHGFIGISEFLIELSDQLDDLLDPLRVVVRKASKCDLKATKD